MFSFPFLVIPSDRYALSRTISTLSNDHIVNHRNKYVFSFIPNFTYRTCNLKLFQLSPVEIYFKEEYNSKLTTFSIQQIEQYNISELRNIPS